MYTAAADEKLRYYTAIDDCLAQCAAVFGGGIASYGRYRLLELLRWTHRAIAATQTEE